MIALFRKASDGQLYFFGVFTSMEVINGVVDRFCKEFKEYRRETFLQMSTIVEPDKWIGGQGEHNLFPLDTPDPKLAELSHIMRGSIDDFEIEIHKVSCEKPLEQ